LIRQWRAFEPWIESHESIYRSYSYPTICLRNILSRRASPIDKIARPIGSLNLIGKVTFGGALFLRSNKQKDGYKGPVFEALPGDLIISKIRVGQGSFCVVRDDLDHVAVSPEYPVYAPDTAKLLPRYLAMVLRTPEFMSRLTGSASGNTTKRRIRPSFFESLQIPLPSLDQQRAIVAAYDAAMAQAAARERAADATEAKAMTDFEAALGFAPPVPLPDRPVFVAFFEDFDRWSHEGVLRRIAGEATTVTTWPMVQLREVVTDLENGWSPKCLDRPAEAEEWGVLKVSAASAGFYRETENKALPVSLRPRPRLEIRAGDVLITRASGVANLVGVSTYVESRQEKLLLCDKLFRIVFRPNSQIDPRFLAVVLRLNFVRSQIVREFSTQSGMMKNVSKPILLSLVFPLPPLDDQLTLIEALETTRAAAKGLRAEAAAARAGARAAFEEAVYAVEPVKGGDIEPTRKAPVSGRA
jgi:type I restriction enzyme S subunit